MNLIECEELISRYVNEEISANSFKRDFIMAYKASEVIPPRDEFEILDRLFYAVDAYCDNITPEIETPFLISEKTLKKEIQLALQQIENL